MINKFLCRMWGHQFDKVWWHDTSNMWVHSGNEYIAEFKTCIHCGARKHD